MNYNMRPDMTRPEVVAYARGDVNGDKIEDNIYLTGIKTASSPFIQNITLVIQDGRTGKYTSIALKENAGYEPVLTLKDFDGDGIDDIMITIQSGGSGAFIYAYIFSFYKNNLKLIFDSDIYNHYYKYNVTYKDNYRAEVISEINKMVYTIDLVYKGSEYLDQIYNQEGKLIEPVSGFVNPVSVLYPIDFNMDGRYELLAYQKIAGRYNADAIGYVQNTLSWQNNSFVLMNQNVAIFGSTV